MKDGDSDSDLSLKDDDEEDEEITSSSNISSNSIHDSINTNSGLNNTTNNNKNKNILSPSSSSSLSSTITTTNKHYRSELEDDDDDFDSHLINKISKINTDDSSLVHNTSNTSSSSNNTTSIVHSPNCNTSTNGGGAVGTKQSRSRIRGRSDDEDDDYRNNIDDDSNLSHPGTIQIFKQKSTHIIRNTRQNNKNNNTSNEEEEDDDNSNMTSNDQDIIKNINNLSFDKNQDDHLSSYSNNNNNNNNNNFNFLLLSPNSSNTTTFPNIYLPTFNGLENLHISNTDNLKSTNSSSSSPDDIDKNILIQQQQQQLLLYSNLLSHQQQLHQIQQQQLQQFQQQQPPINSQQFKQHFLNTAFPTLTSIVSKTPTLPSSSSSPSPSSSSSSSSSQKTTTQAQQAQLPQQPINNQQINHQQNNNIPPNENSFPAFSRIFVICGKDITEQQLIDSFKKFGTIESCKLVLNKITNESKGYSYIQYQKTSSAALAIEEMNGKFIENLNGNSSTSANNTNSTAEVSLNILKVMVAEEKGSKSKPITSSDPEDNPPNSRLFVVCKKEMTEIEIFNRFKEFGNLEYVKLVRERDTNESKGCAFVKFSKFSNAAIALETINQDDKSTKVIFAQPKVKYSNSKQESSSTPPTINLLQNYQSNSSKNQINHTNSSSSSSSSSSNNNSLNNSNSNNSNNNLLFINDPYGQGNHYGYPVSRQRLFVVCHKSITQENLYRLFSKYPGMEYCDLKKDKITNKSKGFAYVNYSTPQAALLAKNELNGIKYPLGHSLKVVFAEPLGFKPSMNGQSPGAILDTNSTTYSQLQYIRMTNQTISSNSTPSPQSIIGVQPSSSTSTNISQSDRKRQKIMFNNDEK